MRVWILQGTLSLLLLGCSLVLAQRPTAIRGTRCLRNEPTWQCIKRNWEEGGRTGRPPWNYHAVCSTPNPPRGCNTRRPQRVTPPLTPTTVNPIIINIYRSGHPCYTTIRNGVQSTVCPPTD